MLIKVKGLNSSGAAVVAILTIRLVERKDKRAILSKSYSSMLKSGEFRRRAADFHQSSKVLEKTLG